MESVGIAQVDRVWLMGILGDVGQMQTKRLAQTPKFNLTLVLQTELEGLLGDLDRAVFRYAAAKSVALQCNKGENLPIDTKLNRVVCAFLELLDNVRILKAQDLVRNTFYKGSVEHTL